jgi:sugar O-acyltransferase (sialic acid O-acetyltransferase NeuD family)
LRQNKIAIVGFGDLGQQIYSLLKQTVVPEECIVFDDGFSGGGDLRAYPFQDYIKDEFGEFAFFVALGYLRFDIKRKIFNELQERSRLIGRFTHPSCYVSPSAKIGAGTVLYPMCNVDKEAEIGEGVLINNSVTVSHNSVIGSGSYISPGAVISGRVKIGEQAFIGAGVCIANGVELGKNVRIGIGSVITRDIPDGASVIGNPMRILDKELRLT